jgi:hypothetical protein
MYTMKKKILAVVAALAIMTVGTTAFAADSPDADDATEALEQEASDFDDATTVDTDEDLGFTIVKTPVEAAVVEAAYDAVDSLTETYEDATLLSVVDLKPEGDYVKGTEVTLFIYHDDIVEGNKYVVLHQNSDGTWDELAATVIEDGMLSFVTDNFSAFAIVDLGEDVEETEESPKTPAAETPAAETPAAETPAAEAPAADAASTDAASTDAGTSPKTGETTPVALFALLACVAGAVACSKKSEKN